ncbi:MAG: hypothetical protein HY243_13795 [Proteobacteria bacterium]|nr:hypothetical protein [Pseudomonadota bacterium]
MADPAHAANECRTVVEIAAELNSSNALDFGLSEASHKKYFSPTLDGLPVPKTVVERVAYLGEVSRFLSTIRPLDCQEELAKRHLSVAKEPQFFRYSTGTEFYSFSRLTFSVDDKDVHLWVRVSYGNLGAESWMTTWRRNGGRWHLTTKLLGVVS